MGKASKRKIVDLICIVYPGNEYEHCLVVLLPIKIADLERKKNGNIIIFEVDSDACIVVTSGSSNMSQNKPLVNTCSIGGSA